MRGTVSPVTIILGPPTKSFLFCIFRAILHVKEDRELTVPYHFHLRQHEYMRVKKGFVDFTLDGKKIRQTPEMEELHIPPRAKHGFTVPKGVEVIMEERSPPDQDGKTLFFRNIFANGDVRTKKPSDCS